MIRNRIFAARHRQRGHRPRAVRGVAAALAFMLVATLAAVARDSALAEEHPTTRPAAGRAVAGSPDAQTQVCFPILDPGGDPVPGDGSDCRPGPINIPPTSCGFDLTWSVQRVTEPDTGSMYSRIGYGGRIDCVGPEKVTMNGRTRVVERTSGQPDGQPVGDQVVDNRIDNMVHPPGQPAGTTTFAATVGITNVRDVNYPAGQNVEVIFEFSLKIVGSGPRGLWGPCPSQPPRPGLRYLSCSGENTDTMTAVLGSSPFSTGVRPVEFCSPSISKNLLREPGESRVTYSGRLACSNFPTLTPQIDASAALVDRTQGRDGIVLHGSGLSTGATDVQVLPTTAVVPDRNFPAGVEVEVVLQLRITASAGISCSAIRLPSTLRWVRPCVREGTNTLTAQIGTGKFRTLVEHPPEECREDHTPRDGYLGGINIGEGHIRVTPHIRYCGYFDMGSNSRVTRVEKLLPTEITVIQAVVCNANFWPDPPAADGVPTSDGQWGKFQVTVRWTLGPCDGVGAAAHYLYIDRSYRPNGTVQNLDREATL